MICSISASRELSLFIVLSLADSATGSRSGISVSSFIDDSRIFADLTVIGASCVIFFSSTSSTLLDSIPSLFSFFFLFLFALLLFALLLFALFLVLVFLVLVFLVLVFLVLV